VRGAGFELVDAIRAEVVRDFPRGDFDRRFLAAIQQLIRSCGLEGIWEGIETAEQAEALRSIGCTSGQGYYFGRPLPGPEFTDQLSRQHTWPA